MLKRISYPTTIALPSWSLNDLSPYLEKVTGDFFTMHQDLVGGLDNIEVLVDEWIPDEDDIGELGHRDFDLPIFIKVRFSDDEHQHPIHQDKMSFCIYLRGIQNFVLDPSTMITYQIFEVNTVSHGNGNKRDYQSIFIKLVEYIASRKLSSYYEESNIVHIQK